MTKPFARFRRKADLADDALLAAAMEVAEGRYEADLGGGVFKKRVARAGSGKSGGFRTILFFKAGSDIFFAHGFAKNEKANVSAKELAALKKLAGVLLGLSGVQVRVAEQAGELVELEEADGGEES